MNKNIIIAILIVAVILLQPIVLVNSGNDTSKQLYTETRKTLPDNLPWYFFAVFGDNRPHDVNDVELPNVFHRILDEAKATNPQGLIGTGDHVGTGLPEQIDHLHDLLVGYENVWLGIGNHDMYGTNYTYWVKRIAPDHFNIDDIPGWRIAFVNSEVRLSTQWTQQLENALGSADGRAVVLVFHRPAYPNVDHNLDGQRKKILFNTMKEYNNVKLVLQGHWHGFAVSKGYNATWYIIGGSGAPLYYYPDHPYEKDTVLVKGRYHYAYLILMPNQTFKVIPIRIDSASGEISVVKINATAYMIYQDKLTVFRNYTYIPVRVNYTYKNWTIYTVLLVPPKKHIMVNYMVADGKVTVTCNASTWYVYAPRKSSTKALVSEGENGRAALTLEVQTTTTTTTMTTTTTTTTGETTTTTSTPSGGVDPLVIGGIIVLVLVLVVVGFYKMRH